MEDRNGGQRWRTEIENRGTDRERPKRHTELK